MFYRSVILFLLPSLFVGMIVPPEADEPACTEQNASIAPAQLPFDLGEKIEYELVYNWGLIWVTAGWVNFEVSKSALPDATYHFSGHGESYPKWNWFYEVKADYESHTRADLTPLIFERKGDEGPHHYDREYVASESGFTYYNADDEKVWSKEIRAERQTFDVISAVYHCRTLDFSGLEIGQTLPFDLLLEGKIFQSHLRYMGEESWTDKRSKKTYDCIVFKPKLIEGTIFKEGENMTVYVTNDEKRIPVYIETELVVGKGKVFLK